MREAVAIERSGASLRARLEARRPEIEHAFLTRIYSISDPSGVADPHYVDALRTAVSTAIDYGLAAIETREERVPPPPPALLVQARLAARSGVSLDIVLRRYCAGYALLGDFLIEEAERAQVDPAEMKRLLRTQANLFDRLLAAVGEEYTREGERRPSSSAQRRVAQVERLLAGERLDTADLAYDFDGWHLGAIAVGRGAEEAIRGLAAAVDRRPLIIDRGEDTVWVWLGGRQRLDPAEFYRIASSSWPAELALTVGEPAENLAGWRLTHRQAAAALPIALRSPERIVRYADVALLASILQDDLLVTSLRQLYLAPLERERDGGETLRETLRAYFAAGGNVSSAAAAIGVDRHTLASRLRTIEDRLHRSPASCAADLEAALRLERLGLLSLPSPPRSLIVRAARPLFPPHTSLGSS